VYKVECTKYKEKAFSKASATNNQNNKIMEQDNIERISNTDEGSEDLNQRTRGNGGGENLLNEEQRDENRAYDKNDKPFTDAEDVPGNPELEKTFDEDEDSEDLENEDTEDPDEQYSDENGEKGISKDTNNREREAEKIQENEDTKNDNREINLNKKL
jgi:hypothetical protein